MCASMPCALFASESTHNSVLSHDIFFGRYINEVNPMTSVSDSSQYEVRPARAEDREAVADLLTRASLPLDGLEEQFGEQYVVADADGKIVGVEGIERYGSSGLLRSAA